MKNPAMSRRSAILAGTAVPATALIGLPALAASSTKAAIVPTGIDVEGPYFRSEAPERSHLGSGRENERLFIDGVVSGVDEAGRAAPIANARVNIWHASPHAIYDLEPSLNYHGFVRTTSNGGYHFDTAIPSAYKDGDLDRPAHVHFKVEAPGFEALTTQMYFQGDVKLDDDVFVKRNNGHNRAVMLERLTRGQFRVVFNIVLVPTATKS